MVTVGAAWGDRLDGGVIAKGPAIACFDPAPALYRTEPAAEPSVPPTADPPIGSDPHVIPDGTDRPDEAAAIPVGVRTDRAIDSALDELAAGGGPAIAGGGDAGPRIVVGPTRRDETLPRTDSPHEAAAWPSRLAAILLVAGWFGRGAGHSAVRNRPAGAPRRRR